MFSFFVLTLYMCSNSTRMVGLWPKSILLSVRIFVVTCLRNTCYHHKNAGLRCRLNIQSLWSRLWPKPQCLQYTHLMSLTFLINEIFKTQMFDWCYTSTSSNVLNHLVQTVLTATVGCNYCPILLEEVWIVSDLTIILHFTEHCCVEQFKIKFIGFSGTWSCRQRFAPFCGWVNVHLFITVSVYVNVHAH
jgi:hypothetical protein